MNRRFVLIAFAVTLMSAVFVAAKSVASWRPTKIGALGFDLEGYANPDLRVSKRYAVAGRRSVYTRFDLQTGAREPIRKPDFLVDGEFLGQLAVVDDVELQLRETGGATTIYNAPNHLVESPDDVYEVEHDPCVVRVTPRLNRVAMVLDGTYYRWNRASRVLERDVPIAENAERAQTISRDGEVVISATIRGIFRNSTTPGRAPVQVALQDVAAYKERQISPFGAYAIYYATVTVDGVSAMGLRIVDAQSGRGLWSLRWKFGEEELKRDMVFSADETRLALCFPDEKLWEIHDTKTGDLLCNLPLLADVQSAAFSPDNALLYSVADSVLYRQRAR